MKRLTVNGCLSQQFSKVLGQHHPLLNSTKTVFAVFDRSVATGVFQGLVTKKDIVLHPGWTFSDFLQDSHQPTLREHTTVRQALVIMKKEKKDTLPVLNANHDMMGIVTRHQLLRAFYEREHLLLLSAREQKTAQTRLNQQQLAESMRLTEVYEAARALVTVLASSSISVGLLQKGITALTTLVDATFGSLGLLDEAAVTKAKQRINDMVHSDYLTGLPNLTKIHEKMTEVLNQPQRYDHQGAILLIDLDNFRDVNDMMGSGVGDLILRRSSKRIARQLHHDDLLARKGGDEFVIMLQGLHSADEATRMAQRILQSLTRPFRVENQTIYITASIGMSMYPSGTQNADVLLARADIALGQAKEMGKNNYQMYMQTMERKVYHKRTMEKALRQALEKDELFLCYQPQIDIKTNQIVGMEALLRWQNNNLGGLILPNDFIPMAEKTGLILPIGEWVLHTACLQASAWQMKARGLRMAVNLSARQLQAMHERDDNQFVHAVKSIFDELHFPPELLEIEITESIIMKNHAAAMGTLKKLRQLGVRIACDDFGTGYSSLNYLKRFPIDTIKIDKSFIDDIAHDSVDIAIIRAIIEMAAELHIVVVAEGVESNEQLTLLRELGCDMVQGYYFSKPVSSEEAILLLDGDSSFCQSNR